MASPTTQWYKSYVSIGSAKIPVRPDATSVTAPRNMIIPDIVGNYWQLNTAPGLIQPVIDVSFVLLDDATFGPLLSLFQAFTTRSADAAHDTSIIAGGITFWNGREGYILNNAKADSFSLSCSPGQEVMLRARFCGTTLSTTTAPTPVLYTAARVLTFANVSFTNALANIPWRWGLNFSNNHTPDLSMNGTTGPAACNAGMMTAAFSVDVQAYDSAAVAAMTSTVLSITGSNIARSFSMPNMLDQTDLNTPITRPRNMKTHGFTLLGGDGTTSPPVAVS